MTPLETMWQLFAADIGIDPAKIEAQRPFLRKIIAATGKRAVVRVFEFESEEEL